MSSQFVLQGLAGFLHDLFTVVWVGGLVMIVLTLLPSMQDVFGNGSQTRDLMNVILQRHRKWVYISIVGLFITGVIQARVEPTFNGLLRFNSLYSTLTSIKHLFTFAMVGITLFRSLVIGKKLENAEPQLMKQGLQLIIVNACLGVGVLLLSGLMAAY
jgi:uncharacterized membrane protein